MFRFIHSSDLHIGRRFGNMPEELRGRLCEARHEVIGRLAQQARDNGADTVLLAGDTFDTETPTPAMRRQVLAEMADHAPLRWVLLPGNHDSLQAAELWSAAREGAPGNVLLALDPSVVDIAPGVALLPAPCTTRRPGRDLTGWMDAAPTAQGVIRIGLAHGAVRDFSEDAAASDVIAPDRAVRAGLDYLALGDWHGPVAVNSRTQYCGTPEPDRFKHGVPGQALLVAITGPGAEPEIVPVETGRFAWRTEQLRLMTGDDGAGALAALLPAGAMRRRTLMRIAAGVRIALGGRTALAAAAADAAPDFAHFELDDSGLETECESDDMDLIDRGGALRAAAEALQAESGDQDRSAEEREVAREALARLFSYCQKLDA